MPSDTDEYKEWKERDSSSQKHATEEELLSKPEWLLARVDEEYRKRASRVEDTLRAQRSVPGNTAKFKKTLWIVE